MRTCRSGFPPVTHAAVVCAMPAAQPDGDQAHSAPVNSASRRADAIHQFVEHHVMLATGIHGRAHFRQFERAANDGQGAAAIDQRTHADRLVDIRAEAKFAGHCGRSRRRADANPEERLGGGEHSTAAEQVAAAERSSSRNRTSSTSWVKGIGLPDNTASPRGRGMTPGLRFGNRFPANSVNRIN